LVRQLDSRQTMLYRELNCKKYRLERADVEEQVLGVTAFVSW